MNFTTISEILRERDLQLSKIRSETKNISAYDTVVGNSKQPLELNKTAGKLQSILDHLKNVCQYTAALRRANVSTYTELQYYKGEQMSVAECSKGMTNEKRYLQLLASKLMSSATYVNTSVNRHNDEQKKRLTQMLDDEYKKHESERKSSREENYTLSENFDSEYTRKIDNVRTAFWQKNKAELYDPIDIFSKINSINLWAEMFTKDVNLCINKANNNSYESSYMIEELTGEPSISLEELLNKMKEYEQQIETLLNRLVLVSWKVGTNGQYKEPNVQNAEKDYDLLSTMIDSYREMKNVYRTMSTFANTGITNSLTKLPMSPVDISDYNHFVVPVITEVIEMINLQKSTCKSTAKTSETNTRSEVVKMLEGSMTNASSRPTADKMKDYTNSIIDSVSTKMVAGENVEKYVQIYQEVLDEFESKINVALSTINSNTKVKVTWNTDTRKKELKSWGTLNCVNGLQRPTTPKLLGSANDRL
jgi:hypothetical protein